MKNPTALSRLITVALAAAAVAPLAAQADEGNLMVRVRAVNIDPANKGNTPTTDAISLNSKVIPEVDFTYFVTPNIAAELILTYPQKHDVKLNGTTIGSLKHLPPTLTAQYHFLPTGQIRPYVGLGINYTNITAVNLPSGLNLDRGNFGLALQAGVDIQVAPKIYVNLDIKQVTIEPKLRSSTGDDLGTVKVNPTLIGVGVGYRF
ncbi:MAG: OmpW family protein [Burkholderiales bacterium]|nr:OmpW family protein [Burkholderiales bacterium]MDE2078399.1 OmpW family protein [Burkholderiales bacterium]MDE2432597.1 OmpW family protein [Burkholderiales bacterium]